MPRRTQKRDLFVRVEFGCVEQKTVPTRKLRVDAIIAPAASFTFPRGIQRMDGVDRARVLSKRIFRELFFAHSATTHVCDDDRSSLQRWDELSLSTFTVHITSEWHPIWLHIIRF